MEDDQLAAGVSREISEALIKPVAAEQRWLRGCSGSSRPFC